MSSSVSPASPDGYNVTVNVNLSQAGGASVLVRATQPGVKIRTLAVAVFQHPSGSLQKQAQVGVLSHSSFPGSSVALLERFEQIAGNGELWASARVEGDVGDPTNVLTADVVRANVVSFVVAGGTIYSDIIATGRLGGAEGTVSRVESVSSDVRGDVIALAGSVLRVLASNGTIGTSAQPSTISARDNIHAVIAQAIHADLIADPASSQGWINTVRCSSGEFVGSITAKGFADLDTGDPALPGMEVSGDASVNMNLSTSLLYPISISGSLLPTSQLIFSEGFYYNPSFNTYGSLTIGDAAGLGGQVIVNAGAGAHGWSGAPVTVGSVTLSPVPDYSNLTAAVGSGAVGVVPFDLHGLDCYPPNGDTVSHIEYIRLRHYGPVQRIGTGSPVTVEFRNTLISPPGPWQTVDESQYYVAMAPDGVERDLLIIPRKYSAWIWDSLGEYRVRPKTGALDPDRLECKYVTPGTAVYDWVYTLFCTP